MSLHLARVRCRWPDTWICVCSITPGLTLSSLTLNIDLTLTPLTLARVRRCRGLTSGYQVTSEVTSFRGADPSPSSVKSAISPGREKQKANSRFLSDPANTSPPSTHQDNFVINYLARPDLGELFLWTWFLYKNRNSALISDPPAGIDCEDRNITSPLTLSF